MSLETSWCNFDDFFTFKKVSKPSWAEGPQFRQCPKERVFFFFVGVFEWKSKGKKVELGDQPLHCKMGAMCALHWSQQKGKVLVHILLAYESFLLNIFSYMKTQTPQAFLTRHHLQNQTLTGQSFTFKTLTKLRLKNLDQSYDFRSCIKRELWQKFWVISALLLCLGSNCKFIQHWLR